MGSGASVDHAIGEDEAKKLAREHWDADVWAKHVAEDGQISADKWNQVAAATAAASAPKLNGVTPATAAADAHHGNGVPASSATVGIQPDEQKPKDKASSAGLAPNDTVVLCGLGSIHDYDVDDPLDGHIGVIVKASVCRDHWVVRLLHRDPEHFVTGAPFRDNPIDTASARAALAASSAAANTPTDTCVVAPEAMPDDSCAQQEVLARGDTMEGQLEHLSNVMELISQLEDGMPDDMLAMLQSLMATPKAPSLKRNLSSGGQEDRLERHDVVVPEENLQKVHNLGVAISLDAFRGYVEIDDNTCAAGMVAGAYNAVHQLQAPSADLHGEIPAVSHQRPSIEPPTRRTGKVKPMSLQDALQLLHEVATATLQETENQLTRRPGDTVLEKRVRRLQKAQRNLADDRFPNTWQIGNMDVDKAMQMLGLVGGVLLSREVKPNSVKDDEHVKRWLWDELRNALASHGTVVMFHLHGVLNGDCFFGHYALVFAAAEYATGESVAPRAAKPVTPRHSSPSAVSKPAQERSRGRKTGSPAPVPGRGGRKSCSPAPSSARQAPSAQSLQRKVLTARSYEGPRHWLDLDKVYHYIFKAKFPGYQIWKYARR